MRVPGIPRDLDRGARVRELREARDLTRKTLAERVGVSPRAVYAWEQEGTPISTPNLRVLAAELGSSPDFILHGKHRDAAVTPIEPRQLDDQRLARRFTALEGRLAALESAVHELVESVGLLIRSMASPPREEREAQPQPRSTRRSGQPTDATPNRRVDD